MLYNIFVILYMLYNIYNSNHHEGEIISVVWILIKTFLLIKKEKQVIFRVTLVQKKYKAFLVNRAKMLNERLAQSTWVGITLPFFYFFFKFV